METITHVTFHIIRFISSKSPQKGINDEKFPRLVLICGREEKSLWTKLTQVKKSDITAILI